MVKKTKGVGIIKPGLIPGGGGGGDGGGWSRSLHAMETHLPRIHLQEKIMCHEF